MTPMLRWALSFVLVLIFSLQPLLGEGGVSTGGKADTGARAEQTPVYPTMPSPGKKVPLGNDLPVNIDMPGDWEVRITIKKDEKVIFRGSHQFDV